MAPMPRIQLPNGNSSIKASTNDFLFAETMSGDSSPTPSSPPSSTAGVAKSQCSSLSDGESFEGYGENEYPTQLREARSSNSNGSHNISNHINNNPNISVGNHSGHNHSGHSNDGNNNLNGSTGVELDLAPHVGSSTPQDDDELNIMPRDNWARRSLRRTPTR
ncbi:GM25457 [Drosophila sechellia]|uniref:GD14483 n=2 Tax=melanogaster subgroup TaxID=32351 RepID=B4QJY6_DROSI|nr:GM25457 [Drosophila sechellia]EDX10424.1 GD14483 [Drosophila simulans]